MTSSNGNQGDRLDRIEALLLAFGRPYISNPDLVARLANNWELNPDADMDVWYSFDAQGYTDFPTYQEAQVSV